jgi:hypothetical protein
MASGVSDMDDDTAFVDFIAFSALKCDDVIGGASSVALPARFKSCEYKYKLDSTLQSGLPMLQHEPYCADQSADL